MIKWIGPVVENSTWTQTQYPDGGIPGDIIINVMILAGIISFIIYAVIYISKNILKRLKI